MEISEESRPFEAQAKFYDLFYSKKPYDQEASLLNELIHRYNSKARSILSIGCGTGRYEVELAKKGFQVTGVDRSPEMLSIARARLNQEPCKDNVTLVLEEGEKLNLGKTFDVVALLFCVVNYLPTFKDLSRLFEVCASHLAPGGLLMFDSWHGPAVKKNPPQPKETSFIFTSGEISRKVMPFEKSESDLFALRYEFTELDQLQLVRARWSEEHLIRPFFPLEIRAAFESAGLISIHSSQWPALTQLNDQSWNALWIGKRES